MLQFQMYEIYVICVGLLSKLKKKRLHIQRILTVVLLWVFSLAITPWGALHHHEEVVSTAVEKHCMHKVHIKTQQETCLICAAHFEKNYTTTNYTYTTYLIGKRITKHNAIVTGSYTELISTALRGPPAFS
ncbi:hypothetical protein [Pedobacter sp. Hv1]|uniref:hypothetical protein n=1 Tax=Pedobacter sp. Hv1 TaxID=1740090 RepID=UPI0006D89CF5|nr:hypothetical protein [Pedobacter sp. Hv1]KQB99383.1 hypothetical protein AQF98_17575 [Pedobacter sp. Hv1]